MKRELAFARMCLECIVRAAFECLRLVVETSSLRRLLASKTCIDSNLLPHPHIQMIRTASLHVGNLIASLDVRSLGRVTATAYVPDQQPTQCRISRDDVPFPNCPNDAEASSDFLP